jgi:hypothetical protein
VLIVKLLLSDKYCNEIDIEGSYVINDAIDEGNTEVLKLLLEDKRVDPCLEGEDDDVIPIDRACRAGHAGMVKLACHHHVRCTNLMYPEYSCHSHLYAATTAYFAPV